MRVARLELRDFRCYERVELEPHPRMTLLVGGNAQGKTSLLEAVGWLASTASFRGAPDGALVREGTERAVLRAVVHEGESEHLLEAEIAERGRNRIQVNRKALARTRDLAEVLRVVVFSPDDLVLVKGSPADRRTYLDELAATLSRRSDHSGREYERVLRQRNAWLRSGGRAAGDDATLDVWDEQLARLGAGVLRGRLRLAARLLPLLRESYERLSGGGPCDVAATYESPWTEESLEGLELEELEASLRSALSRRRRADLERGMTTSGPHRDDWAVALDGRDARRHASQGEQRCLALGLRLAAHRVVAEVTGRSPVLLLDDIFSELDDARSDALVGCLPEAQVLLASVSSPPGGLPVGLRVTVEQGRLAGTVE